MFRLWNTVPAVRQQTLRYANTKKCADSLPQLRFVQFTKKHKATNIRLGVVSEDGENFVNLSEVCLFPQKITSFLKSDTVPCFSELQVRLDKGLIESEKMNDCINILAPILDNVKILSTNIPKPSANLPLYQDSEIEPLISCKLPNAVIGPTQDIIIPDDLDEVDCQTELAVIIGKKGKNITKEKAMDHVFGYTVALNINAAILNDKLVCGKHSLIASSSDTFCVLGPTVVHKSLINNPHCLVVSLKVNEDSVQCENTSGLLFKIEEIIEFISRYITLDPGDVILTGPASGCGVHHKPYRLSLQDGDEIECEIEQIGRLSNTVIKNENVKEKENANRC